MKNPQNNMRKQRNNGQFWDSEGSKVTDEIKVTTKIKLFRIFLIISCNLPIVFPIPFRISAITRFRSSCRDASA